MPGSQLAQSCHVAFTFSKEHPEITNDWMCNSNYICLLSVSNEDELHSLIRQASQQGIALSIFREPDIGDRITAIALAPGPKTKKLCIKLPLALRGEL